jgi:hypothetical protein
MKEKKMTTAQVIKRRLAKNLEKSYNEGGDYKGVIFNIRGSGASFTGTLIVKVRGCSDFTVLHVRDELPPKPCNGWSVRLVGVKVSSIK